MSAPLCEESSPLFGSQNAIGGFTAGHEGRAEVESDQVALSGSLPATEARLDFVDAGHDVSDGVDDEMGPCAEVLLVSGGA